MATEARATVEDDAVTQLKSADSRFSEPERIQQSTPEDVETTQPLPEQVLTFHAECLRARAGARKHEAQWAYADLRSPNTSPITKSAGDWRQLRWRCVASSKTASTFWRWVVFPFGEEGFDCLTANLQHGEATFYRNQPVL
jgi:hypothetical protein